MRTHDKPSSFQPGQSSISAGALNKMISGIPRSVTGSNGIVVKDFGDRMVIAPTVGQIIPPPDVQSFMVVEEFDDHLVCRPFSFPVNQAWQYSDFIGQEGVLADVDVLVAKPITLQRTGWDGLTATIGGVVYTYTYTDRGRRDAQVNRSDLVLEEKITPAYFPGDIITACKKQVSNTELGTVLQWADINDAGRQWLSLGSDGGMIAGDTQLQGDLRVVGDEEDPSGVYIGPFTTLYFWNEETEEYEPFEPEDSTYSLLVQESDEDPFDADVTEININELHNLELELLDPGKVKINWLGVTIYDDGIEVGTRRILNFLSVENLFAWDFFDDEDNGKIDITPVLEGPDAVFDVIVDQECNNGVLTMTKRQVTMVDGHVTALGEEVESETTCCPCDPDVCEQPGTLEYDIVSDCVCWDGREGTVTKSGDNWLDDDPAAVCSGDDPFMNLECGLGIWTLTLWSGACILTPTSVTEDPFEVVFELDGTEGCVFCTEPTTITFRHVTP